MRLLTITLASVALLTASGCAVTTAGIKKGDERNFARSLNDVSAGRVIKARMSRVAEHDLGDVDVEVAEGIVVLTGNVSTMEERLEAERVAWSAPNVTQVGNEIGINGNPSFMRKTKDTVLDSRIRARLIADKSVKGRNVNTEVHNGVVYLLGVARTPQELERIAQIAASTKGTLEVISYMKLAEPTISPASLNAQPTAPTTLRPLPQGLSNTPQGGSPYAAPVPQTGQTYGTPQAQPQPQLGVGAPQSAEPYYRDPVTGERITLPPGTKTVPLNRPVSQFPTDDQLGKYRTGPSGETMSVIESEPFYIDPQTGQKIPVKTIPVQ